VSKGAKLPRGFDRKSYLRLALPMIISRAGLAAMGIADGIMVSRFSPHEFAWLSLAEGTVGRLLDVFLSFLIGGLALVPRHFSRGDKAGARWIWLRTFPVAVGLGLLALIVAFFGTSLLTLLGQAHEVSAGAAPCMVILAAGYPAALMAIAAAIYLEGINRPQFVAVAVVSANVINVALNWLFIGGHLGLPAMGARGSALSTTIVRCALGIALAAFAWRWHREEPFEDTETHRAERTASRRAQWRLGAGAGVTVAAMATLTAPLTLIAGRLGIIPLATFSAAWNIAGPAALVALGMADAAGIYVASEAAQGDLRAAAKAAWSALYVTLVPIAVAAVALSLWAFPCAWLYTRDATMRVSLAAVLPFVGLTVLVDSVGFVMISALRSLRETAWPTGIQIGAMALLVPLAFSLAWQRGYGVPGLFIAMLASGCVRALLLVWRFWGRTNGKAPELAVPVEQEWSLNVE
jgi:MATE family multidrug resistance protein